MNTHTYLLYTVCYVLTVVPPATKPAAMISERLSSPRLSQGGSAIPRNSSTVLQKSNSQLGLVKSQLSVPNVTHLESVESVKREEFELIRTLANTHCLLAEVSSHMYSYTACRPS